MRKKLTDTQKQLLKKIELYKYIKNNNGIFSFDNMKQICNFKSFDSTFNALLNKGYIKRQITNNFENNYYINI